MVEEDADTVAQDRRVALDPIEGNGKGREEGGTRRKEPPRTRGRSLRTGGVGRRR